MVMSAIGLRKKFTGGCGPVVPMSSSERSVVTGFGNGTSVTGTGMGAKVSVLGLASEGEAE